jgi:hypothetical protein
MHPQVMVVGLDPAHRAHDLGIDIAQETREARCRPSPRRPPARRPWTSGAARRPGTDNAATHEEHDEDVRSQGGRDRLSWFIATALKAVTALPNSGAITALPITSARNGSSPGYCATTRRIALPQQGRRRDDTAPVDTLKPTVIVSKVENGPTTTAIIASVIQASTPMVAPRPVVIRSKRVRTRIANVMIYPAIPRTIARRQLMIKIIDDASRT